MYFVYAMLFIYLATIGNGSCTGDSLIKGVGGFYGWVCARLQGVLHLLSIYDS